MNLYFVVEGPQTEKKIYRAWLQHFFPHLTEVSRVEDVAKDNFYIIAGGGYPKYKCRINIAQEDMTTIRSVDYFFICVDAEEYTYDQKYTEIETLLTNKSGFQCHFIIIQHACIETWFLGNRKFIRTNPQSQELRDWKAFHDVTQEDPEHMPARPPPSTRAKTHAAYLEKAVREHGLKYSKSRPGETTQKHYFQALRERWHDTQHIPSFGRLVEAFESIGADFSE